MSLRPSTSQSKLRTGKSVSKSLSNLHDLKKSSQNFPSIRNTVGIDRIKRSSSRDFKAKGKLHLGNLSKPQMVLSKQQRMNPWAKRAIISEQTIARKGIINLMNMGIINKQFDCFQLLNNRYQLIINKQATIVDAEPQKDAFLTNPALRDAYYEISKMNEVDQNVKQKQKEQIKAKIEEKVLKKTSITKKKVVKKEQTPKYQFLIQEKVKLNILNFHVQQNQSYRQYIKYLRRNGLQHIFRQYLKSIQNFTSKYNLKKITIIPNLDQTKKLTQRDILNTIINHKLFGIDLKLKGNCKSIFRWLFLAKIQKMRFKHKKQALNRIQKFKNKFKVKKYYREMITQRWKLIKFKLGSFAQNQRRLVSDNINRVIKPQVQIHILSSNSSSKQLQTFYKWQQRKKAQLTRLFNNQSDHIILILNRQDENIDRWLEQIQSLPSNWKKPKIHVFYTESFRDCFQESAEIYFNLHSEQIIKIKQICSEKNAVLVPYYLTPYLPKICELFGANLDAGTYNQESKAILYEQDDNQAIIKESDQDFQAKFKKIKYNSKDLNEVYSLKLKKIVLAGEIYQSKVKVKQLFSLLDIPTPISVCIKDTNETDFFREFTKMVLTNKQYSRWILKLPDSTFSRGLAYFQTQSLKIIKQAKKRAVVRQQDIDQISQIIQSILIQKISLPHNSLMSGDEFIAIFKQKQGYIQSVLEETVTVCIFGRIQTNGVMSLLGSYRKYSADNVSFGALYPAEEVNSQMVKYIRSACSKLYQSNFFGYLTFEILFNTKTKEYYFIDMVPHLDQFSSFYFYYKRILDISQIDSGVFTNQLKRFMFYCPFIDNNGNKFDKFEDLQQKLKEKKLIFDKTNIQGLKFLSLNEPEPSVLSLISFSSSEGNCIKLCLDGLRWLVQNGAQFNKFDKKFKNSQTDGLYIMDIIWKMRQLKKQIGDK